MVGNDARDLGGAIYISRAGLVEVSNVTLMSNKASLGGAVYILAVDDKETIFKACVFDTNEAADGGAVYLYTGPGVDIFTASVFRNNLAGELPRNTSRCGIETPQRKIAHLQSINDRVR